MTALKDYRKATGRTLEEMAATLGVSVASLSRIEHGQQWPSREFFVKLAQATNGKVTVNDFVPKPHNRGRP